MTRKRYNTHDPSIVKLATRQYCFARCHTLQRSKLPAVVSSQPERPRRGVVRVPPKGTSTGCTNIAIRLCQHRLHEHNHSFMSPQYAQTQSCVYVSTGCTNTFIRLCQHTLHEHNHSFFVSTRCTNTIIRLCQHRLNEHNHSFSVSTGCTNIAIRLCQHRLHKHNHSFMSPQTAQTQSCVFVSTGCTNTIIRLCQYRLHKHNHSV